MKGILSRLAFKGFHFLVAIIVKVCMDIYVFYKSCSKKKIFLLVKIFKYPIFYVDVIMAGNGATLWTFQQCTFKCDSAL